MLRRSDNAGWVSPFSSGVELLDRGEHHAAGIHRELAAKVGPVLGLHRRLAQQLLAAGEGAEELVVQVIAVGQDDDGRILHRRLADDGTGVEGHGEALAGALGVPDDADAAVARLSAGLLASLVAPGGFGGAQQLGGTQGFVHGDADGVELVVAGHLLGRRAAVVLEHDEVPQQGEEAARLEDALQHHLQFSHVRVGKRLPGDGAPGLEPLPAASERADTGLDPVRGHQRLVHGEQRGQLGFVGLKLVPGRADGGVLVGRVLEFDQAKGQAIDEQNDMGTAVVPVLGDGELVDGKPVVVGTVLEVDDEDLVSTHVALGIAILDFDAIH